MPEVTDLMRVAQYAKSSRDTPSEVYNAACRLLDGLACERTLPGDAEEDEQWRWSEREVDGGFSGNEFPRLWPPRNTPESHGDARTPQTLGAAGQDGAREVQGARE